MATAESKTATRAPGAAEQPAAPKFTLQRKCACGGGGASALTGECDDCGKKKLQRRASGSAPQEIPQSVGDVLATSGTPLDPAARRDMETRFEHDFSSVRIHTDQRAAESARDVNALAYTAGSHVVFGPGQYAPSTPDGRHLLAHELTHTIQQHGGLHRQEAGVTSPTDATEIEADRAADTVTGTYLVEDDAQPGSGQMRKTEFLDELQRSSCAAADEELARVERSTEGCPYVEQAFQHYRGMPAARVERSLRRYVDASAATSAHDYIPLVTRRVAEGVSRWATTGDMSGVPAELAGAAMGGGGGILGMLGGGLAAIAGGIGRLLFKRDVGGGATPAEAAMVSSSLGRGAPLDGGVRGRMESAFGHDFSQVRIHADGRAAGMSSSLGARAFTLGGDIGFGAGEYRPNTPEGDALIAHELAHVVQQSGGGGGSTHEVEEDADHSAVSAVTSLWGGAKRVARSAMPRLRSGLRLQRCSSSEFPWEGILVKDAEVHATVPAAAPAAAAPAAAAPAAEAPAAEAPAASNAADAKTAPATAPAAPAGTKLTRGTRVIVRAKSGGYLQIETKKGKTKGWVEIAAVDDVVAHEMQRMYEEKIEATWQKSAGKVEGGTNNDFQKWAQADSEKPLPELNTGMTLNCWEMILYAANKTGVLSWYEIHQMYMTDPLNMWPARLVKSRKEYVPPASIRRGNLVFFDNMDHVAMATGNGDEVYSFWPPPDKPIVANPPWDATVDSIEITTVRALADWMEKNGTKKKRPVVEQGQPSW